MTVNDILEARARLLARGIMPDRIEVNETIEGAPGFISGGNGSLFGCNLRWGDENRVGGYDKPPPRLVIRGREWEPI